MHFEIKSIQDIPDYRYEGYYWYSDSQAPQVILDERIDKSKFTEIPFVIEANFFARKENVSIQVRNIDGQYYVSGFRFIGIEDSDKHVIREYFAHDLKTGKTSIKKFEMVEAWEETNDPLLENMTTLQPSWAAFRGFKI